MNSVSEQSAIAPEDGAPDPLSPEKTIVLEALLNGKTVVEAAASANVCRRTVERWRDYDAPFIAERNRRLKLINAATDDRLQSVSAESLDLIIDSIRRKKNVASARMVVRALGLLKQPDSGPITQAEVSRKQQLDERERKLKEIERSDALDELEFRQAARRADRKKKLREIEHDLGQPEKTHLGGKSA